jgi:hypothetical protein
LLVWPYAPRVSAYQANARQGKLTLVAGVAAVLSGFVVQAINLHSLTTQGPPMMFTDIGSTVLLGQIAGFVILGGVILTIVGIVRYAQSGSDSTSVVAASPAQPTVASTFCSSCGARIVSEGRYCPSCGTPTIS